MDTRLKHSLRRKLATHRRGNQRVGVERSQVAGVHACDDCSCGIGPECARDNRKLAEVVLFADFDKSLHIKRLRPFRHAYKLFVIQNARNQENGIGTAAVGNVDFVFVEQEILAKHGAGVQALLTTAFHQVGHRNQVTERTLKEIAFGKHRHRLRMRFGISRR